MRSPSASASAGAGAVASAVASPGLARLSLAAPTSFSFSSSLAVYAYFSTFCKVRRARQRASSGRQAGTKREECGGAGREAGWTQAVLDRRSDFVARRKTCDFKLTGSSFEPASDPAPALALWHWSRRRRRAPPPTPCTCLRLALSLKSAAQKKGNVFHFLHFNAIFNLFVLVEAVAGRRRLSRRHVACGMWLLQLVTLVCWATHIPSLIGISWLQALELVKSSEFLEVGKGAGKEEKK